MKQILFCVFCLSGILRMNAQSSTEYNIQGDRAFEKNDFRTALTLYCEGLGECDSYSIEKLVEIWKTQPAMQESMQLPMLMCFNCMKKIVEEDRELKMMYLYSDFYKYGIGTQKNDSLYNYWYNEFVVQTILDIAPERLNIPEDSIETKIPKKSLLSNRFCSFITYTYSPTMPFGFTAGIYFDKIGGYVSGRTDYNTVSAAYECNNTQVPGIDIENPPYEFNRERWYSRMITGGFLYPVIKNRLFVSAGGGYGKREYYREVKSTNNANFLTGNKSEWCYNTEASYKGLTLEAGGMFIWRKLTVLGGVNSTRFKDLDVYIGLGLTF